MVEKVKKITLADVYFCRNSGDVNARPNLSLWVEFQPNLCCDSKYLIEQIIEYNEKPMVKL